MGCPQPGDLDHEHAAGGKGDREVGTARVFPILRFIHQTQGALSEEQVGRFQLELEIAQDLG